ncbi:alpha/beta-hydrolase [Penicillium angulare]|uniref:alpha/beta-hydrolase n=1 Tax=Penicillium angulare TaxID=116970 RepID=UPI0025419D39|nr:alpha/beta-hydrolase [Penicillium angulare]KAJ5272607.1 alpha/beta-hydrolase [Penicillium angulare]
MANSIHRRISASTQLSYLSNIPSLPRDTPITRISLMIHGWTCRATHYIPLITLLSEQGFGAENGYLYIAVDLPGHGESSSSTLPEPEKGGLIELLQVFYEEILSGLPSQTGADSETNNSNPIPLDFYGHSMGTRVGFGLYSFLSSTIFNDMKVLPTHFIFLDGSFTSTNPPDPISISMMNQYEEILKERALGGMHKYFGSRTSESFKTEMRTFMAYSDFPYLLRIAHWYSGYDCFIPSLMDDLSTRNHEWVSEGKEPVRILNIQGQEVGPDGRHSIHKDFVTVYMGLLREHLTPWVTEYVIEDTSHFVHVDDVEEVARQLVHLHAGGVDAVNSKHEQARL